ncbi:hypothetical protein GCM10025868_07240 [Angustibacter aerolatus]|uniref:ABC-2 type transporter domain-containing protein n=1 Tax=Angustibacter aerolatus TaxID=1162965 RepID=A0ABQ6JEA1_9ACTN|nr:hypothetical protein [Angustibacter aerolatus]GMA85474.1 hypothetical protein GCM10025868_07240 [Angustibacter aerolatus]
MLSLALAGTVVERNVMTYRRQWVAFLTGFLEPVFYLASLGLGLGALIDSVTLGDGRTVTYAQFMAPAMLALSAMNGAVFDATYNMFFKPALHAHVRRHAGDAGRPARHRGGRDGVVAAAGRGLRGRVPAGVGRAGPDDEPGGRCSPSRRRP